jgi:hypothetical protein
MVLYGNEKEWGLIQAIGRSYPAGKFTSFFSFTFLAIILYFELSTYPQSVSLPPVPPHVDNNNCSNINVNLKVGRQGIALLLCCLVYAGLWRFHK